MTEWNAESWKAARQKGRTNLLWLCRNVLGYKDVSRAVHGPILDALQKFQGGTEEVTQRPNGSFALTPKSYTPACDLWQLEGARNVAVFYPRGHLKTTLVTFANAIQWIINYPNVRIVLNTCTDKQAREFLSEIKNHFIQNQTFRFLYPEFCPKERNKTGKVEDFGNQEMFIVPNRTKTSKEPTISTVTVGSIVASGHYEVGLFDDLVDKENVRTPEQIATVKNHFALMDPLIERMNKPIGHVGEWKHGGWKYLAGTFYDFSDLNYALYEAEKETPTDWVVVCKSAAPNYPEGPTLWDERWPISELKKIEDDVTRGPSVLYSQYLMNPIPSKSGLVESEDEIVWIPRQNLDGILPRLTQHVTIDLAGMEAATNKQADNDFTVINLHGFGQDGRLYINRIWRGRYDPFDVMNIIFEIHARYPRVIDFKISKDHFARTLLPFLNREMQRRQKWLPIVPIAISNRVSKVQKIKGLQPWFRNKSICFAGDLDCRAAVINEIMRFPKYAHDDILDTIADAMETRDGEVTPDVLGRPKTPWEIETQRETLLPNGEIRTEYKSPFPEAMTWALMEKQSHEEVTQLCPITGW